AHFGFCIDRFAGQAAQPDRVAFPELVPGFLRSLLLQRNGAADSRGALQRYLAKAVRPVAGRPGFSAVARQSLYLAGADSIPFADRMGTIAVLAFRPGSNSGSGLIVAKGPIYRVPILCFFNRFGLSGFLYRLYFRTGPGA